MAAAGFGGGRGLIGAGAAARAGAGVARTGIGATGVVEIVANGSLATTASNAAVGASNPAPETDAKGSTTAAGLGEKGSVGDVVVAAAVVAGVGANKSEIADDADGLTRLLLTEANRSLLLIDFGAKGSTAAAGFGAKGSAATTLWGFCCCC